MEWFAGKGKTSTDSGAATRAPLAPGINSAGAAARGQAAELIDADVAAGYAQGVAGTKSASPAQRKADEARVAMEINATLRRAGVPPVQVVFEPRLAGKHGEFDQRSWQLRINVTEFHDPGTRTAMLGTVYHEARHAEQYFDAIRVAAQRSPGSSTQALAAWIASQGAYVPPLAVIEAARADPPPEASCERWFERYFGKAAEKHRKTQARKNYVFRQARALNQELMQMRKRVDAGELVSAAERRDLSRRWKPVWAEVARIDQLAKALVDEVDAESAEALVLSELERTP